AAFASLISTIHSSSCSLGRALSAGNEPTMPEVHCAITSFGTETMNIGAPMAGSRSRFCKDFGNAMNSPLDQPAPAGRGIFRRTCFGYQTENHTAKMKTPSDATISAASGSDGHQIAAASHAAETRNAKNQTNVMRSLVRRKIGLFQNCRGTCSLAYCSVKG